MSATRPLRNTSTARGLLHPSRARTVALMGVAALVGGFAVTAAGGGAAAATRYRSQSVGNFLDATVGGTTLDQLASVQYATANSPGTESTQNPLDATALGALDVPLTNAVKLPSFGGIQLGAVNQVATAKSDGSSLGASGAVDNSGGASVGGDDTAYPASATIDLTAAGLSGTSSIPGADSLSSLGGITVSAQGVSGIALTDDTPAAVTPKYTIADLDLTLGSPALGALLGQLTTALTDNPLPGTLSGVLGTVLGGLPPGGITLPVLGTLPTGTTLPVGSLQADLPTSCTLTSAGLGSTLSLEGGAVTIDASTGSIAISVRKLLTQLGLDLDDLPANTDLTTYVLGYLTRATGLTQGIENLIDGLVSNLENQFSACETDLGKIDPTGLVSGLTAQLTNAVDSSRTQFEGIVNDLIGSPSGVGGTGIPLSAIGDALGDVVDIGANVQHGPGAAESNGDALFTSALDNTPKQGTPVVAGQTLVRALEVDLLPVATASLPGGLTPPPAAGGATGAVLALGNAAAGPSTRIAVAATTSAPPSDSPTTTTPTTSGPAQPAAGSTPSNTVVPGVYTVPSNAIPNAVPAGDAGHRTNAAVLPLTLVLLGLLVGGAAAYGCRRRLPRR